MRPRVFPAEDRRIAHDAERIGPASMRPRVFPAEDSLSGSLAGAGGHCFNEAAGIPRGRLDVMEDYIQHEEASLRPRVFPAEDTGVRSFSLASK